MANSFAIRQNVFVASAFDLTSGTLVEFPNLDILATPFEVKRLVLSITTDMAGDAAVVVVGWRPDEGSSTGAVTLGTFTVPVAANDGEMYQVDLFTRSPQAATSILSAGGSGGLGGSERFEARESNIIGPGGAFTLDGDGAPTGGAADIWAEVLIHPFVGEPIDGDNQDVTSLAVS